MAPELLFPSMFGKIKCQVSKEADIYAFGMVILQVSFYSERYSFLCSRVPLRPGFDLSDAVSYPPGHRNIIQGYPG